MDTSLIKKIIIAIIIIVVISIVAYMVKNMKNILRRKVNKISKDILGLSVNDVKNIVTAVNTISSISEDIVGPKSVSGATDIYLKQIERDFPDFHKNDAEIAIRNFVTEFLNIKYEGKKKFENSKVDNSILSLMEKETIKVDVKNLTFNKVAIAGYKKTEEYATIDYNVSVGYEIKEKRIETRYKVKYTLRLNENSIASKAMICPNCGATIESTSITKCEYCDTKIIRDTIFNWIIASIEEY